MSGHVVERRIGALVLVAVGVWLLVESFSLEHRDRPYTWFAVGGLILCAALLFARRAGATATESTSESDVDTEEDAASAVAPATRSASRRGALRALVIAVTLVVYVAAWSLIGFWICTVVFTVLALLVLGERRLRTLVAVPVVLTFGMYLLFVGLLPLPLPSGPLQPVWLW